MALIRSILASPTATSLIVCDDYCDAPGRHLSLNKSRSRAMIRQSTLRIATAAFAIALTISACSIVPGVITRGNGHVVLAIDRPPLYGMDTAMQPAGVVDTLDMRAGDTITTLGYFSGASTPGFYYVISHGTRELLLAGRHGLNDAELSIAAMSSRFMIDRKDDRAAWQRAKAYISRNPNTPLTISSENLLKTSPPGDSIAIAYTITRVPSDTAAAYEVRCTSHRKYFDAEEHAKYAAFYIINGKYHAFDR